MQTMEKESLGFSAHKKSRQTDSVCEWICVCMRKREKERGERKTCGVLTDRGINTLPGPDLQMPVQRVEGQGDGGWRV